MQVREVMSREVLVTSPDDTIEKAATLMGQVDCGLYLSAIDNDRLVGIVTAWISRFAPARRGTRPTVVPCAKSRRSALSMYLITRLQKPRRKV